MSHPSYYSSHAQSKGSKLGYYRASLACDHCRKRKTRCLPSANEAQVGCANCVRLGRRCIAVKVEVMHALDDLGGDTSPEGILRAQLAIGHLTPRPEAHSSRIVKARAPAVSSQPGRSWSDRRAPYIAPHHDRQAQGSSRPPPLVSTHSYGAPFTGQPASQSYLDAGNGISPVSSEDSEFNLSSTARVDTTSTDRVSRDYRYDIDPEEAQLQRGVGLPVLHDGARAQMSMTAAYTEPWSTANTARESFIGHPSLIESSMFPLVPTEGTEHADNYGMAPPELPEWASHHNELWQQNTC